MQSQLRTHSVLRKKPGHYRRMLLMSSQCPVAVVTPSVDRHAQVIVLPRCIDALPHWCVVVSVCPVPSFRASTAVACHNAPHREDPHITPGPYSFLLSNTCDKAALPTRIRICKIMLTWTHTSGRTRKADQRKAANMMLQAVTDQGLQRLHTEALIL